MTRVLLATAIAMAVACSTAASAQTAAAPGCTSPESRQFDFWVGRWVVSNTLTGAPEGSSLIERLYGGCAIRENWTEPQMQGGSLNYYDAHTGQWRQLWIDQAGGHRDFIGGMVDGRMVLVAETPMTRTPGKLARVRMTFTANPDGSVRQYSDVSLDEGKTWSERYDYTYRRAP